MNAEQQLTPTLLSAERAKIMIAQSSFTAREKKLVDHLTRAVSAAAQSYCRRTFSLREYDEIHHGCDQPALSLRNPPIRQVQRVAYWTTPALSIQNTAAGCLRSTAQVALDGLKLQRATSAGIFTEATILLADDINVAEAAAAVTALGNGWVGAAVAPYGDYPTSDLRALQGSFACKSAPALLKLHAYDLDDFETDDDAGLLYRASGAQWGDEPPGSFLAWPGGRNAYRVIYSAGWSEIPQDVQQACAEWVADLFWSGQERPVQVGELLPTSHVRLLLSPYRRHAL